MKKKSMFLLIIFISLVIIIFTLRITNSKFRYSFDVNFNTTKEHKSYYVNGTKTTIFNLPLPSSTAFAFKHSDTAVTYYTKLSYEQFMNYYKRNEFDVDEKIVIYNGAKFKISSVEQDIKNFKYYFVDIDLLKNE